MHRATCRSFSSCERLIEGPLLLVRSEHELPRRSYVDLADVVVHVLAQMAPTTVTVRSDLAEAPTMGEPVLLDRLVHNLVDNAVKYNVAVDGWLHVTTCTTPTTVFVRVSNTGPVVPQYEIPNLFEPFRRFGADRVAAPGAGLGLSIVQAVTRAHSGTVGAESRDGGGLTVTVSLPLAAPSAE